MDFKKALVPSAFAVAGLTAMLFQPASNATPQESEEVVSSAETIAPEAEGVKLVGRIEGGTHSSGENSSNGKRPQEDGTTTDNTDTDKGSDGTDAKEVKGVVKKSDASVLREGGAPKKLDLEKYNITPEPTPEPVIQEEEVVNAQEQQTYDDPSPSPQTPSAAPAFNAATGNAVVDAALSQVGTPYVYGGSQPGGFDCSGLTSWAYAQAGKSIPRTSGDQWASGQAVSVDNMQPGDIVVSYGGGHVGIYIGNGQMVHSPTTGDVVKVSPLQPIDGVVRF